MKKILFLLILFTSSAHASWEVFNSCVEEKINDPSLKSFFSKIDLTKDEFEKMTNDTFATSEDQIFIKQFADITNYCKTQQLSTISIQDKENNLYVINWIKNQESRTALLADLYLKNITYATYNKARKNDSLAFETKRTNLNKFYDEKERSEQEQQYLYDQQKRADKSRMLGDVFGNMGNAVRGMQKPSVSCNPNGFNGGFTCR